MIIMKKGEFVKEHRNLIKLIKNLTKEGEKQKAELKKVLKHKK